MCLFSLVLGNGTQTSAAHCIYLLIHVDLGSECRAFLKVPPPCAPLIESMQVGLSVISEGQTNPFSDMEHGSKIHNIWTQKLAVGTGECGREWLGCLQSPGS
uniref:Uncharacterized protein n=1 Tax=Mus musculus TaxID=10090 RepID=Q3TZX4_MOUSE|nr:unnamed protein product [Mus musculus]